MSERHRPRSPFQTTQYIKTPFPSLYLSSANAMLSHELKPKDIEMPRVPHMQCMLLVLSDNPRKAFPFFISDDSVHAQKPRQVSSAAAKAAAAPSRPA